MIPFWFLSRSRFLILEGAPRTIKTFLMSHLAFDAAKRGEEIRPNYELSFGKYQSNVKRWQDVEELKRVSNCWILFDEGQLKANNRTWADFSPSFYHLLEQYGHRKITFILTTQDLDGVDIKIRRLAEATGDIVYCSTIKFFRIPWDIRKPALFQLSFINRFPFILIISKLWHKKIYDTYEDTNLEVMTIEGIFNCTTRKMEVLIKDSQ
jgi:hypothetical protein